MKASEMTNEDLYDELWLIIYDDYFDPKDHERSVLEEAAARLRKCAEGCYLDNIDLNNKVDALRAKLKVAEDALVVCRDGMCGECHRQHPGETCVCPNGCYEMSTAKNALAAIREEGESK